MNVNVDTFTGVDVRGPLEMCLTIDANLAAGPQTVRVEAADAAMLQRVNVHTAEDRILHVDFDASGDMHRTGWPFVKVTAECRSVRCLRAAGAAKIDVKSAGELGNAASLTIVASGASNIRLHAVTSVNVLDMSASGASIITLDKGRASILHGTVSGSSTISADRFNAATAHLRASGASQLGARASDLAHATASGASQVNVKGSARRGVVAATGVATIRFE